MIYTETTKKALKLSFEAHKDQKDKGGMPYVFHPFHLAEQMTSEDAVVVALLHDVVEDTDLSLDDIRARGFPKRVIEALALLAHDEATPYLDYVAKIKTNPLARAVKLADLEHNCDPSRLDKVEEKDKARVEKYQKALAFLRGEPQSESNPPEAAFRKGYPEFKLLLETTRDAGEPNREDAEKALKNIKKRERGEEYTLSEHLDAMVFSLLSNQRKWKPIEDNADRIREIFHNFDAAWLVATATERPQTIIDELTKIKCGNRQIKKQIAALPENVRTLQRIAEEHGGIDAYYNKTQARDAVRELSAGKYKLKQMGVPLVSEYLRNVGVDLAKPDVHVMRLLYRLGYTRHPAKTDEALDVCEKIAKAYGMRQIDVDAILWGYCADGRLKICTADPNCKECRVCPCANYQTVRSEREGRHGVK